MERRGKKDDGSKKENGPGGKNVEKKAPVKRSSDSTEEFVPVPEKKETPSAWLRRKAQDVQYPTEEASTLHPQYIFGDKTPLVIYLCQSCTEYNKARNPVSLANGLTDLRIAMCNICRANMNASRTSRYFNWTLPLVKRDDIGTSSASIEIDSD